MNILKMLHDLTTEALRAAYHAALRAVLAGEVEDCPWTMYQRVNEQAGQPA
jgi:hypothetical protein